MITSEMLKTAATAKAQRAAESLRAGFITEAEYRRTINRCRCGWKRNPDTDDQMGRRLTLEMLLR